MSKTSGCNCQVIKGVLQGDSKEQVRAARCLSLWGQEEQELSVAGTDHKGIAGDVPAQVAR